jgi:ATP-dependent exoDNAse (exonuclease V) alpha subunit
MDEYTEKYGILQFGYASTCHSAQGSAWDHIVLHLYDIPHFIDSSTKRKFIYTAVSRARKSLTIVL